MSRTLYFMTVLPNLCLLSLLPGLSLSLGGRKWYRCSWSWVLRSHLFSTLWLVVSHCINHLHYNKKLLWWGVRATWINAYKDKYFRRQFDVISAWSVCLFLFLLRVFPLLQLNAEIKKIQHICFKSHSESEQDNDLRAYRYKRKILIYLLSRTPSKISIHNNGWRVSSAVENICCIGMGTRVWTLALM